MNFANIILRTKKRIVVVGIDTNVGKSIISAVLVEALCADYWKPIQAGDLHNTDSMKVKQLISNSISIIHSEYIRLNYAVSPHEASKKEGKKIIVKNIIIPKTNNHLIIETAGGIYTPINSTKTMLDLIQKFGFSVVLVSKHYLGSINHTLLTVEVLKQHRVKISGIVFNGESNSSSEKIILSKTKLQLLGKIPLMSTINKESIRQCSKEIKHQFLR